MSETILIALLALPVAAGVFAFWIGLLARQSGWDPMTTIVTICCVDKNGRGVVLFMNDRRDDGSGLSGGGALADRDAGADGSAEIILGAS
jgi:hypothetical protein